jgi:hypothetical protein
LKTSKKYSKNEVRSFLPALNTYPAIHIQRKEEEGATKD